MTEVPIIFPSHAISPPRFIVNDAERSIRRCETQSTRAGGESHKQTPLLGDDVSTNAILCGSASASSLKFQAGAANAMLTTSALVENPRILSLGLLGNTADSPVIVELDLGSETKHYGNTVKVQASVDVVNGQECIRLVLVADNAVIVTTQLSPHTLAPLDTNVVEVVNVRNLLDSDPVMKEAVSGSLLHKTMVAFYSPTCMVLALSPLLMSVDLKNNSCEVWLESQCLEDMRARASTIGSIFSKASDLLLGRLDDGTLVDMAPTAALCVSSTGNPLFDPTFVFTLHSDGKIKRWTVSDDSPRPVEVHPITLDIPSPRDWSDAYNSVYLAARLYGQVYVLAVHIQTSNGSSQVDDEQEGQGSNSHIFAVYGGMDGNVKHGESLEMSIPNEAAGLVDLDFVQNSNNCSLTAMFRSTTRDRYGALTTLMAQYPPSVVSILSTQPEIAPIEYFLDGVAQAERARISSLLFNDEVEGIEATSSLPLEDEIHLMDSRFMNFVFRPAYPRGSGTVTPPQEVHIQNAIQKVVYGRARPVDSGTGRMSIELKTLRALQEWRTSENRNMSKPPSQKNARITDGNSNALSAASVYENYVAVSAGENDEDEDETEMMDSVENQMERERVFALEMHARRWRRLLLAIWEEEQSIRSPLGFFLVGTAAGEYEGGAVLVRSDFTSLVVDSNLESNDDHPLATLDAAAMKLIKAIESHDDCSQKLLVTEQRIWNNLSNAQLDELSPGDISEECSRIVDFAFDSAQGAVFSIQEQQHLGRSLGNIPLEDYMFLLQETPRQRCLPVLSLMGTTNDRAAPETGTPRNLVANAQVRHAACALSARCFDSSRRLLLARYLLVSYLVRSSQVSTAAFFTYLRTLAVIWAHTQEVGMPAAFAGSTAGKGAWNEPPKKRLSFGDSSESILPNTTTTTTCMDSLLISILQFGGNWTEASPFSLAMCLSREIFASSLRSTLPSAGDVASGKLHRLLPELGALPPSSNPAVATDHPRLALRILAPLISLGSTQEAPNVKTARKETLAECLLVESHKQLSETARSRMRAYACELLASNFSASGSMEEVWEAFGLLRSTESQQLVEEQVNILARMVQVLIYGEEGEVRSEIRRLVELETARSLFSRLPEVGPQEIAADVEAAVQLLAPRLLHLSNLMHRVDILEHHVGRSYDSNEMILDFINNAIAELEDLFPAEICEELPEKLVLYNRLFHSAVSTKEWNQAYDACLGTPSLEHKISNFKRLVNSMIGAGALQELLDMCSTVASSASPSECVDLYSIAADALSESSSQDLYVVRANANGDASKAAPDYQGSLYSLHVSRGEWRSAAQSLDLCYMNAMRALGNGSSGLDQGSQVATLREKLIAQDIVLSSVGTANALCLVDDTAAQYILSGENGHLSPMHVTEEGQKRQRGGNSLESGSSSLDKIGRFTTLSDLQSRAAWSIAFRKFCLDGSADFSMQKSALLDKGSPCVDHQALGQLSAWGYYLNYLLLAMAMRKPNTADKSNAFHDALLDLLTGTLVPLSSGFLGSAGRPSISQLRLALDGICTMPGRSPRRVPYFPGNYSQGVQSCLHILGMDLVKKFTSLHTSAEHPVGLQVASCLLENDEKLADLPLWLKQLMMRGCSADPASSAGLFDRRPKANSKVYLGDPSALLTLYLRHGMLLEACHLVVEALSKEVGAENSHTQLPEKGFVVFAPYKKIDTLWNLIDTSLGRIDVEEETKHKLREGQNRLFASLETHLQAMKTNEMGMRSARALNRQNFL